MIDLVRSPTVAGGMPERHDRNLVERGLDALARLGMLGLLLAIPAACVWGVRRLLRRDR